MRSQEKKRKRIKIQDPNDCPLKRRPRSLAWAPQRQHFLETKINHLVKGKRSTKQKERGKESREKLKALKEAKQIETIGTRPDIATICPNDEQIYGLTKKGFQCCFNTTIGDAELGDIVEVTTPDNVYLAFVSDISPGLLGDVTQLEIFHPGSQSGILTDTNLLYINDEATAIQRLNVLARLGSDYVSSFLWQFREHLPLMV